MHGLLYALLRTCGTDADTGQLTKISQGHLVLNKVAQLQMMVAMALKSQVLAASTGR